jgi:hypothetical protein
LPTNSNDSLEGTRLPSILSPLSVVVAVAVVVASVAALVVESVGHLKQGNSQAGGRCCDFVFVLRGHGWSITSGELSVK